MVRRFSMTVGVAALLAGCGASEEPQQQAAAAPAQPAAPAETTVSTPTGDVVYTQAMHDNPPYKKVHDLLWLMENVVQPTADVFWGSAGYVIDSEGEHSLTPTTDEAWANVVTHTAILSELGNVLMTPPYSEGKGDDWFQFAGSLIDIAVRAQEAAEARSEEQIFDVGATMDRVCEGCHLVYQDPNTIYDAVGVPSLLTQTDDANDLPNPADAADVDMDEEATAN